MFKKILLAAAVAVSLSAAAAASGAVAIVKLENNKTLYRCGEKIVFTAGVKNAPHKMFQYELFINGFRVRCQKLETAKLHKIPVSLKEPGWVALFVSVIDASGKVVPRYRKAVTHAGGLGAMVEPEKILPGRAMPEDFEKFWSANKADLKKIPVKAVKKNVKLNKRFRNFQAWDVRVDCGKTPVSGFLTMPVKAAAESLPAVVSYHGAGVSSAKLYFRNNTISFDINAHGIENGKKPPFYTALSRKELFRYWLRGKEDRDQFYFKEMYLRALRALEYVKTLPQWDGKTLIVYGISQGGAQALAAAALDPDVTLCVAGVPAMSDHGAGLLSRRPGWPRLSIMRKGVLSDPEAEKCSRYYDSCNFARFIRCPVYLSTGYLDFTCSPTSVYAVYNMLKVKKHLDVVINGTHRTNPATGDKVIKEITSKRR